jgi:hypothetical protein
VNLEGPPSFFSELAELRGMNNNLMQIEDEEEPHVVVSEHHMDFAQAVVDQRVVQSTRTNAISSFGREFKLFRYAENFSLLS